MSFVWCPPWFRDLLTYPSFHLAAAGYLPCDPDYPDDRLSIYLEDAQASVLLTQASHLERSLGLVDGSCRVVDTACILSEASGCTSNPPASRSSPDGTAYIIFTSGSTGRPKGVLVAHRGVRDLMPWLTELHGLGEFGSAFSALVSSVCLGFHLTASTPCLQVLTML